MDDTTPCRSKALAGRGSNPLRTDVTVAQSELLRRHERREGKNLSINLTAVNPCAPTILEKEAKRLGSAIMTAVNPKTNRYRGTFPVTYNLPLLTVHMCGTPGLETQAIIKATTVRPIDLEDDMPVGRARAGEEGRGTARLTCRFSSVLAAVSALSTHRTPFLLARSGERGGCPIYTRTSRRLKPHQDRRSSDDLGEMAGTWERESPYASAIGRLHTLHYRTRVP